MSPQPGALGRLARAMGVQTSWTGNDGRRHTVAAEPLAAVLGALGAELTSPAQAEAAWAAWQAQQGRQVLPPVLVGRVRGEGGRGPKVPIGDPGVLERAELSVVLEDGETRTVRPTEPPRSDRRASGGDPPGHAGASLDLGALGALPPGYHQLVLEGPGLEARSTLVLAPRRLGLPERAWAVFAPLHALRDEPDWGVGRYPDLARLGGEAQRAAGSPTRPVVATLPLFAGLLDGPDADPSPYRPASRLALAELHVDPEALAGLVPEPEVLAGLEAARREARRLARGDLADQAASWALTRRALEPLATGILGAQGSAGPRASLARWLAERPEVVAYCWFRALREAGRHHAGRDAALALLPRPLGDALTPGSVLRSPGCSRRLSAPAVDQVLVEAQRIPAFGTYLVAQWAAHHQLAEVRAAQRLLGDLPVGVHPGGFDPWWDTEAFVPEASCGAPPDTFFAGGQDWGLAPLHPLGSSRQGHRYLAACIRAALRHARVLRIDHVMGLHRLWLVPPGASAVDGCYVRYPAAELRAVAVLEADRAGAVVVGEDLGTVPHRVRQAMASDGMLRTVVWQFTATPEDPLPQFPEAALASLGTHDTQPFAAFLEEDEPARRALRRALGGDLPTALARCLAHLGASPARLAQTDLADLVFERRPQNRPGVAEGSFRLRHPAPFRAILAQPAVGRLLAELARSRGGPVQADPEGAP